MKFRYDIVTTDIVIVGGGGAGLRAAIEADTQGVKLTILSKEPFGRAHTEKAMGGLNVAIKPPATPNQHYEDTVKGGAEINNQALVDTFTREMPDRIYDLESYGVRFDRLPDGTFYTWAGGKQSAPLNLCCGDYTGREIMKGLAQEVRRRKIPFYANHYVTKIFVDKGRVAGVLALDNNTKKFIVFQSKAVILAAGGAGQLYKITSNEPTNTGEGYALALDAGAELIDMEMVQFHPTGMAYPKEVQGSLITEKVRGHKGKLYNSLGERFMERYQPQRLELAGRDEVSRAIYTEVQQGRGTKHGGVWLDVTELTKEEIHKLIPDVEEKFRRVGVDISKERMEITPTMHHMMGGVRINEWGESTVRGLFACGEVAGGVHGANRLGGNSLAELQVFGRRAGIKSSQLVRTSKNTHAQTVKIQKELKRIHGILAKIQGISFHQIRKELQSAMWDFVGIERDKKKLTQAKKRIEVLKKKAKNIKATVRTLQGALETIEMLTVAETIVTAALKRTESRGAHFRKDYPKTNPSWEKNIVVVKKNSRLMTKTRPVVRIKPS